MLNEAKIEIDWNHNPTPSAPARSTRDTVERIHEILLKRANFLPEEEASLRSLNGIHRERIFSYVRENREIVMVLPAFPAKSPNPEKTMGVLPDFAEVLGLKHLHELCRQIQEIYEPGARIVICSDGRVFSDLVRVGDQAVTDYSLALKEVIKTFGFKGISMFNLEDVFKGETFEQMRAILVKSYGRSLEDIRNDVKTDEKEKNLFCGIHRFVLEDLLVVGEPLSKNQLSKQSKTIAYQVIQRSHAWSGLVESFFPQAIRLSIHPQARSSRKLGIGLVASPDQWRTPWHSVALFDGQEFILVQHKTALGLGARKKLYNGQYGYFTLEAGASL